MPYLKITDQLTRDYFFKDKFIQPIDMITLVHTLAKTIERTQFLSAIQG